MGGESEAAGRGVLNDLVACGLRSPEFLSVDGDAGLEKALAALWLEVPTQRCTVHKHRNLLAHAPDELHEEVNADYTDMIYAKTQSRETMPPFIMRETWLPACAGMNGIFALSRSSQHKRSRGRAIAMIVKHVGPDLWPRNRRRS